MTKPTERDAAFSLYCFQVNLRVPNVREIKKSVGKLVVVMVRRAVPYPKVLPQPPPPSFRVFCMETHGDCVISHEECTFL